jgi:hypothetical protein
MGLLLMTAAKGSQKEAGLLTGRESRMLIRLWRVAQFPRPVLRETERRNREAAFGPPDRGGFADFIPTPQNRAIL